MGFEIHLKIDRIITMEELQEKFRKLVIFVLYSFAGVWISIIVQEVIHAKGRFPPVGFVIILFVLSLCLIPHYFVNKKFKKKKVEENRSGTE